MGKLVLLISICMMAWLSLAQVILNKTLSINYVEVFVKAGDEFYDNRCICICPSFTVIKEAETNRKIYIDILNKENCSCENVLSKWKPNQTEMLRQFCPRCQCNFEVRNTTTMKVWP